MKIGPLLREALETILSNKVRSALTMLGIIIGVASVIAMMAIGAGAQSSITSRIERLGTNLLYVRSGGEATNPKPLTIKDAEAIANPNLASSILYVAPLLQEQMAVSTGGESVTTSVIGVTPQYFRVQTAEVSEGQIISDTHLNNYASVVLLGSQVADDLFGRTTDLIGESVRIRNQVFKIVGVLKEQGGTGFQNLDDRVLLPITTAQLRLMRRDNPEEVDMIYVQATNSESVDQAIQQVSRILRARHRTSGKDDFDIMSTQSFLETASAITATMTAFLGGIAGISLLVGGIGIMNIMLVTVTERTREIGLRKAVGARKSDIRIQFLVEASVLSSTGGLIGILLGWVIALIINQIAASSNISLNPIVKLDAVLMATVFSILVGLFFGFYPANRAAALEPVEALRHE